MENDLTTLRRQQDSRYLPLLNNGHIVELMSIGIPYAGDGDNPRPLPTITLHDLKKKYDRTLRAYQDIVPESLYFSFYNNKFSIDPQKAISLPAEHLWWIVSFQDTVLLSDRITHHYTAVSHIDREKERIYFVDPWAKDFFLLKGLNAINANAILESEGIVSISKKEFLRSVTGLITIGSPTLIENYITAFPESRANYNICLRFGLCLLDAEEIGLASFGANYLLETLALIEKNFEHGELNFVISHCYFAITWALFHHLSKKNLSEYRLWKSKLKSLIDKYSFERVTDGVNHHDFCRLGIAAGDVNEFAGACYFFDRALKIEPKHERAYWYRAISKFKLGQYTDAADDIEKALDLNTQNIQNMENQRNSRHEHERLDRGEDDGRIAALREFRRNEVNLANEIWKMLVKVNPSGIGSRYKLLATIIKESDEVQAMGTAFIQAFQREQQQNKKP